MKKIVLGIIVLLVGISFGLSASYAHAADITAEIAPTNAYRASLQASINSLHNVLASLQTQEVTIETSPAINADEAKILKQGLDILATVLFTLQTQLQNTSDANLSQITASLTQIASSLQSLSADLGSASVIAESDNLVPSNAVSINTAPPAPNGNISLLDESDESLNGEAALIDSGATNSISAPTIIGIAGILCLAIGLWLRKKRNAMRNAQNGRRDGRGERHGNAPQPTQQQYAVKH